MSHSYKHIPIFNHTTAKSNKWSKKKNHKLFRLLEKNDKQPKKMREVMDEWSYEGDGKFYYKEATKKDLRK
ncbi:hypothetical protein EZS27_004668 [termite gut metagenome]|uniref:Uncharacterized protein n=1 Tax=termite gut metagenome TaxID=433724 RepID=A0A5J4SPJ6_9ZZZZ